MSRIILCLVLMALPVSAQIVTENAEGRVRVAGNELIVESKVDDPSAVRVGAPETQRSLGKISFDLLAGSHDELVLIQGKQTEHNNVLSGRGGEFYLGLKRENAASTDDAMVDALTATVAGGFRFRLPVYAPEFIGPLGVGLSVTGNHLVSDRWRLYVQSDGNLVLYELVGEALCARWAVTWIKFNGSGYIDRWVLSPACQ